MIAAAESTTASGGGYATLLAVMGLVTISLTMLRNRYRRRPQITRPANPATPRSSLTLDTAARRSLEQTILQLEEAAREVNAQLDTKFVRLERVITHADQRIARLEALLRQAGEVAEERTFGAGGLTASEAASEAASGKANAPTKAPAQAAAEPRGTRAAANGDGAAPAPPIANPPAPPPARPRGPVPANPLHARIAALAEQGKAAIEIAKAVKMPLGEVEVVLNLRKFR